MRLSSCKRVPQEHSTILLRRTRQAAELAVCTQTQEESNYDSLTIAETRTPGPAPDESQTWPDPDDSNNINRNPPQWADDMEGRLAFKAWIRSSGRMETRTNIIAVANSSVGRGCLLWITYAEALIPYPARVVMPDNAMIKRMMNARRAAIQSGTPWCPLRAFSAMGVMHGVKSSPRCLKVSTWARRARAHIRGAPLGPAHARAEQSEHWRHAIEHANHIAIHGYDGDAHCNGAIDRAARVFIRTAGARCIDSQVDPTPGTGHSLYMIIWHRANVTNHNTWTRARSSARRWSTGDGSEWLALSEAQNITDAARLLRLLCNALPRRARWRPTSQSIDHRCHQCEAQPVQLVWRSPSPPDAEDIDNGMAWCAACIQPGMIDHSWASLPDHMTPSSLSEQALSIRQEREFTGFDTRQSHYGACPLCGAEHIWLWCTAAVMAWATCGDGTSWREALSGHCSDKLRLTVVASQIAFLYTALLDRTSITADGAARRINKAVRAMVAISDNPTGNGAESDNDNPRVDVDTWSTHSECVRCNRGEQSLCRTACRRQPTQNSHHTAETETHVGATAAARTSVNGGRIMATVYADNLRTSTVDGCICLLVATTSRRTGETCQLRMAFPKMQALRTSRSKPVCEAAD